MVAYRLYTRLKGNKEWHCFNTYQYLRNAKYNANRLKEDDPEIETRIKKTKEVLKFPWNRI